MAETRAEQDRQNCQEGFEVLPNVTVLISFYLNEGGKKFRFIKRNPVFRSPPQPTEIWKS